MLAIVEKKKSRVMINLFKSIKKCLPNPYSQNMEVITLKENRLKKQKRIVTLKFTPNILMKMRTKIGRGS